MSIEEFVQRTSQSIDRIGFLFGAGASFEAGYPLVAGLTEQVVNGLSPDDRALLDEVLASFELRYDPEHRTPNIEDISDRVMEHHTNSGLEKYAQLRETIRGLVRDVILAVEDHDISHHVNFLSGLQRRAFSRSTRVYILTTNYDLLFEEAAAEVGIRIVNGFSGAIHRFFSEREFGLSYGDITGTRFTPDPSLTIVLIKLHGSVSWFLDGERVREIDPARIDSGQQRCMVLPRRTKVIETLRRPYDRLFTMCANLLGGTCRYLISSGFSFSDQHINDSLIIPKVRSGAINLYNFCGTEPSSICDVRNYASVQHVCSDRIVLGGRETENQSDLWKFSEFAKQF